jgi:hypothetical protein
MNSSTNLRIDPPVLERVSRTLRHAALAVLDESAVPPPDTGGSAVLTRRELAVVTATTVALGTELAALADGLDRVLTLAGEADGEVAWVFDALLVGAVS